LRLKPNFAACTANAGASVAASGCLGELFALPRYIEPVERRRRIYKQVDVAPEEGGFAVRLDGRTPRSPDGLRLVAPTEALAGLSAEEWQAQGAEILPATMPATRMAWNALALRDAPAARAEAAVRVAHFAGSDLLCYFADGPAELIERQERRWGPVIAWAERELDVAFARAQGIVHAPQPLATVERIGALARAEDDFALIGLASAASLFGSAILALALRRGELTGQAAFDLSRLDETFQEERWGVDAEAEARAEAMAREALTLERWFVACGIEKRIV
jgi:chaperone required for assembly of F1-ATPase